MWKYNPNTNQWTSVNGPTSGAVYGSKGIGSSSNIPGGRRNAIGWKDAGANFWLMGGQNFISGDNVRKEFNDLWKYNPATNIWTWISGDNIRTQNGIYGTRGVASAANKPGARHSAVSWTDAAGNLWLMGGSGYASSTSGGLNDLWKFNTPTNFYYKDHDGDGYGDFNITVTTTDPTPPQGYVFNGADCNDNDITVYPKAQEICDDKHNDCDGQVDEGIGPLWYQDNDNDGYGNQNVFQRGCKQPAGFVSQQGDCNDTDAAINPRATEICGNGKDENCDGLIDQRAGPIWYRDFDNDGFGSSVVTVQACTQPAGYSPYNTDCNDANAAVNPGAKEVCGNTTDENCDGQIGEGCSGNPFLVINPAFAYESQGLVNVTVNLSKKSTKAIKVNYRTVNQTATSPADYTSKTGTLTIPAGSQTGTISIIVINDNISEPTEYFTVVLSQPSNATVSVGTAFIAILDGTAAQTTAAPATFNFTRAFSINESIF